MNKLFVYVEGDYDKIFVDYILSDYLRINKAIELWPIKYAEKPPKIINKDIKSKSRHNYLFLYQIWTIRNSHALLLERKIGSRIMLI